MLQRNLKRILFPNGLIDSENDSDNENQNNFTLQKKRRTICSTSESEAETIEEDNDSYCDIWTSKTFIPKIHEFTSEDSGIKGNISRSAKILDYFQLFVSEEFVQLIANETNEYWSRKNNNINNIEGTVLAELYCFFAVSFLMSRNKKLSLAEYWSKDELLRSNIFGEIITRDRYFKLLGMLQFTHDLGPTNDRLYKIRNIIDMLRKTFSQSFQPYQRLRINESLLLYKGRLSFKKYILSKRNRFGIKSFILSDCQTGFVQDLIVYAGSSTMLSSGNKDTGKSGAIVEALMKPYLGKGHTLYVDDWYSSPALFSLLHNNCTNACGTVRKRRKGMPKIDDRLKRGEATSRSSNNLLVIKWVGKKEVYMLSTMHTSKFEMAVRHGGKRVIQKPVCILDYNNSMGTVDKADMVISTVNSTRKSLKWYRKFFFHLLDICVWNAYCLYKHKMKEPISMAKFQLQLIREILEKYHQSANHQCRTGNNHPLRLTERHFPSVYVSIGKNRSRRCVVCSANDKRRESKYECKSCNVGLCVDPCFKIYHSELNY
nr:piggyBac transposable element-derived protein 4-like [Megalopta genalis]